MSLVAKQHRFTQAVSKLLQYAHSQGFQVTFGEAYRPPEMAELYAKQGKGIKNSCHTIRLAVDLNLFIDGKYITDKTGHDVLGAYWESLDPDARWGGGFNDPNHYSFEHQGVK